MFRTAGKSLGVAVRCLLVSATLLAQPVWADGPGKSDPCEASNPQDARAQADRLMQLNAYQRAGDCYVAAGEYELANHAFLKAVGPASSTAEQEAARGRDEARAQLRRLQTAFHHQH
jgi:hypothetical protein